MAKREKIESTNEAWENGQLGRDEEFVEKVNIDTSVIDDSLALQAISIRLQKGLLEDLKNIAQIREIGYQSLIKQVLKRFADAEMKLILREVAAAEARKELESSEEVQEMRKAC